MRKSRFISFYNTILFLILFLCSFLYLYKLHILPFALHGDEGETALQALEILHGNVGIIGLGWYDLPLLSFVPHSITMKIFGETILGDRLASVVFGIGTLVFMYLVNRLLFSQRVALIGTLLFGTSHMWIALSRLGMPYNQAVFLTLGSVYFFIKAWYSEKKRYYALAGIFLGFCFYSYFAARLTPLILIPYALALVFKNDSFLKKFVYFAIVITFFCLTLLPQIKTYVDNPHSFMSRTNSVYIFSSESHEWLENEYKTNNIPTILLLQLQRSLNILAGDTSGQYGYKNSLLDYFTLGFFFIGIVYILLNRSLATITFFIWFICTLVIGQILTTSPSPIFVPRFAVGLPTVYTITTLGIFFALGMLKKRLLKLTLTSIIVLTIVLQNIFSYFVIYKEQHITGLAGDGNAMIATHISYFLNNQSKDTNAVLFTEPNLNAQFTTLRFLAPHRSKVSFDPNVILSDKIVSDFEGRSVVFITYIQNKYILNRIQKLLPGGTLMDYKNSDDRILFSLYKISQ